MAGFPTRPSRAAFGPTFRNATAGVTNPETHAGAALLGLLAWQAAGNSVAGNLTWALLAWDGAALTLSASAEAWDSTSAVLPTVARTSAGLYTVTYAASYADETAALITTNLRAAICAAQGTAARYAVASIASGRIITVSVFDAAGAAADSDGVLVVAW